MNAMSLYPGLDGFARSLQAYLALPKEILPPDQELIARDLSRISDVTSNPTISPHIKDAQYPSRCACRRQVTWNASQKRSNCLK